MSDGVKITIPAERTESGETESFNVSTQQARDIAQQAIEGIVTERINGDPDLDDHGEARGGLTREELRGLENALRPAYGWA